MTGISAFDFDDGSGPFLYNRHFASFAPLNLLANTTYYIGMSGVRDTGSFTFALASFNRAVPIDDNSMWIFVNGIPVAQYFANYGDMAFRLYAQPVPEPNDYAMLFAGLALIAGVYRKKLKSDGVDAGRIAQPKIEIVPSDPGQPVRLKLGLTGA